MRRLVAVAALGLLLVGPSLASAQFSFGFGRGSRGGNYYYGNYGYPAYGWSGYGGYGGYYRPYYYGNYYSYYPSWGWGNNYYYPGTAYYYPDTNYYSSPSYSYSYSQPSYSSPSYDMSGYSGVYQAGYGAPAGNRVRLQVIVPDPNAELLIQGERMSTMGPNRMFISPDLEPGKTYSYTIVLRKPTAGAASEEKRTVDVQPGGTYTIDFSRPSGERMPNDRSERLPAPGSDYKAPSSEKPKYDNPPPPHD